MKLYISKSDTMTDKNIVVDDMILTKDLPTSAGSKMLDGYMSLFDAEVVTKLSAAGYNILGKANTGELNLDLLGETSYQGACIDDEGKITNACAEIIKAKDAMATILLDVNGSPRRAAAINRLTYVKPTYGTVSRFGTIPAVCSGETVGVMAQSAEECQEVLAVIAGYDSKDGTSIPEEKRNLTSASAIKKIAVAKSLVDSASLEVKESIDAFITRAKENNIEVIDIEAKELLTSKAAWNILMSAEVCNNVSKYDGIKYGHRSANYKNIDELYTNSRTEAFGYFLKSTILFGSETLSTENYMKVYDKALRMRRVLSEYMNKLLSEFDAVIMPACSKFSYTEEEVKENKYIAYDESLYTAPASITGLPSVVTNGVQLIGKAFSEKSLLDMANLFEKEGK